MKPKKVNQHNKDNESNARNKRKENEGKVNQDNKDKAENARNKNKEKNEDNKDNQDNDDDHNKKCNVIANIAPDPYFPYKNLHHVYHDLNRVYNVTLNNNSKYCIIQILESNSEPYLYYSWMRQGQTGFPGSNEIYGPENNPISCINQFYKKLEQELYTLNCYDVTEYFNFQTYQNNNYKDNYDHRQNYFHPHQPNLHERESVLEKNDIDQKLEQIGYNTKKLPVNHLNAEIITNARQILKQIELTIKNKETNKLNLSGPIFDEIISNLSSQYYNLIPHNFSSNEIVQIDKQSLNAELNLMNYLSSICNIPNGNYEMSGFDDKYDVNWNGTMNAIQNKNVYFHDRRNTNRFLHRKFLERDYKRNFRY